LCLIRTSDIFHHLLMRACLRGNKSYSYVLFTTCQNTLSAVACEFIYWRNAELVHLISGIIDPLLSLIYKALKVKVPLLS